MSGNVGIFSYNPNTIPPVSVGKFVYDNGYNNSTTTLAPPILKFRYIGEDQDYSVKSSEQTKFVSDEDLHKSFLETVDKYKDCNEADGSSYKFCINEGCTERNKGEWCADFVTYVVKETYSNYELEGPKGFGSHDVGEMKNWAERSGYFLNIANKQNKANIIANKVKPGDIVILNENASHTGFVTKVYSDGSFSAIEGNRNDKVDTASYNPNDTRISGFIQLKAL